jgi:oxygen-independent coproporphyrinogen-3 oxidase
MRGMGEVAATRRDRGASGPADVVDSFDGPVGAYVHVPFCEWICPFCPYNKVRADRELAVRYFAALRREIDWYVAERGRTRAQPFTSLYIGGGTPTLYPDELAEVIARSPYQGTGGRGAADGTPGA